MVKTNIMNGLKRIAIAAFITSFPTVSYAEMPTELKNLFKNIADLIINPLIILGFVVATAYFFWGIIRLIYKSSDGGDLKAQQNTVMYGVIGLLVMFSVYGILRLILGTFGIPCPGLLFFS